ncbi:aminopeptidase [Heliobacterium undosum]|uniref:Aminopeptidase n=1 Tax=Heliomicrobium undosum TaxID=121734 RepID=A0A845KZ44_9FIRM|nr:M55 family metallopeptidase [Heliomicrobium undosum]MZP28943.1 aminopeptidase [Heliomicrobium undosum]
MRVYISADLEGVAGVVSPAQLVSGPAYEEARRWMTAEVAAAVRGAQRAGARQVVVNDAHEAMTNLRLEDLPPGVEVISGKPKALGMMCAIDAGWDLAFLTGCHARQGSGGLLSHSYSASTIARLCLNGREVGELGLNISLALACNVPVGLVTGDAAAVAEALELFPGLRTVAVKTAYGRQAARTLTPGEACSRIEAAAGEAVAAPCQSDEIRHWQPQPPYTLAVDFASPVMADAVSYMPLTRRESPCRITMEQAELPALFRAFQAMLTIAGAVAR